MCPLSRAVGLHERLTIIERQNDFHYDVLDIAPQARVRRPTSDIDNRCLRTLIQQHLEEQGKEDHR